MSSNNDPSTLEHLHKKKSHGYKNYILKTLKTLENRTKNHKTTAQQISSKPQRTDAQWQNLVHKSAFLLLLLSTKKQAFVVFFFFFSFVLLYY